ncbi:hypothetical protein GYMLUDRAFT_257858 [Collybiopsis luxurians FD-317 M1]|nr:hypothetical protein GYMLUDRAFT_257858 [Collybiopsis luxurians FD-317 M1]
MDLPLPSTFVLRDLSKITGAFFELKVNPYQEQANRSSEEWFKLMNTYEGQNLARFLSHRFDIFAGLSFPDADQEHLETCIKFFFWAFALDDSSDEGELQDKPDRHQQGVDVCLSVFQNPDKPTGFPFAEMLRSLWAILTRSSPKGVCERFAIAVENFCKAQVRQAGNRADRMILPVNDFIVMRRHTIGDALVKAIVEYSLDLDIPDYVFAHPIICEILDATNDITTWPNDICSFNKEQADGDYQNLVYCVMVEQGVELQIAIDTVIEMVQDRIKEYIHLKAQVPSFGLDIDNQVARYLKALEHFIQGTLMWYYSPRYFGDLDLSVRDDLVVPVLPRACV